MSLNTNYTKMQDWVRTTYIGLKELPPGEDMGEWLASGEWVKVEFEDDPESAEFNAVAKEEGWIVYRLDPTVEAIIFAGMVMQPKGGGGITEKNFDEFAERLLIWQELQGPIGSRFYPEKTQHPRFKNAQTYWRDYYLTKEDLRKYIGLWTNCSYVPPIEFRKKIEQVLKDKARRRENETAKRAEEFKLLEKVAEANKAADEDPEVQCGNCNWKGRESQTNEAKDLGERVDDGEEMPVGECPECGALVHLVVKA